ncbi:MAG: response regulator transcription factor [Pseudomonadota bacterium]
MNPKPSEPISILVADDHPVVREGLASIFDRVDGFACAAQASGVEEAIEEWEKLQPKVGIFDLRMADGDAVSAITRIRKNNPDARILVVSSFDGDEEVYRTMKAGAWGYMLKDSPPDMIVSAVRGIVGGQRHLPANLASKLAERVGETDLSPREVEILTKAASGKSNRAIAENLGISPSTIKFHLNNVYSKLGVSSRTSAISLAVKRGIISID